MEGNMTGNKTKDAPRRCVVIHGHFYQPPRENPWIDIIEKQPSATPQDNWNERIYDQCYRPNAYSRLLDSEGMIVDIHNNYLSMSFNFGPTLFSWLERYHPLTARRIIESDSQSCSALEGHGNAIAQVYNHIIMPLSSKRDQLTQIRWAKQFFRSRFKREPEGIWLAETAINMETVLCLIEEKFKFVILSPNQADNFRHIGDDSKWVSAEPHKLNTRYPYRIFPRNPSGQQLPGYLDVFFFDEGLSKEVSFNNLLKDSNVFGERINSCFDQHSTDPQVVTIATDGETFGHHKPFGDMCLAYFFKHVAQKLNITPVSFGYFLAKNPPRFEVRLKNEFGEGTAWSCAHGVGRWIRDCGCKTGGNDSWNQAWRTPLREALVNLQGKIDREYEKAFSSYDVDPWIIRDRYVLTFSRQPIKDFKNLLSEYGIETDGREQLYAFKKFLEAQKFILFSFTSCGWFFSDISGIETMQNLAYAFRAIQLGIDPQNQAETLENFLCDLEKARSNLPNTNGRTLFERYLLFSSDHQEIIAFTGAVHKSFAVNKNNRFDLFGYTLSLRPVQTMKAGGFQYESYSVQIENEQTGEHSGWSVMISHRGNSDISGWVLPIEAVPISRKNGIRPELWMSHKDVKRLNLMDIFDTSRHELMDLFLKRISDDTNARFSTWIKKHERELDILSLLKSSLPTYCTAPLSFVFQEQWNKTIMRLGKKGSEEKAFSKLLQLDRDMQRFEITIDLKKSAALLEDILVSELKRLSCDPGAEKCDRVRCLLNVVDRFSVPVTKSKLEDLFHPVLNIEVKKLHQQCCPDSPIEMKKVDREKKALLITLLNFARRMNFNTESFKMAEFQNK